MKRFYSPSTNGFYIDKIHKDRMPADCVEITDEEHEQLLAGQDIDVGIEPTGPDLKPSLKARPLPSLEEAKTRKLREINRKAQDAVSAVLSTYPAAETISWPKQEEEARKWIVDPGQATPMLTAIAARRGLEMSDLSARVIAKADAFASFSGDIFGRRQALEDTLDALTDVAEVLAMPVEF